MAIVKVDVGFQMEDVGDWIGSLPGLARSPWDSFGRRGPKSPLKIKTVEALGLAVGSEAGV
jgi:hypothetical protein